MLIKTFGGAVYGIGAAIITIEVNIIQGASFYLVGLPDSAVKESQFRIESTFKSNNYRMPGTKGYCKHGTGRSEEGRSRL